MEGCSSNTSSPFLPLKKPDESLSPFQIWDFVEWNGIETGLDKGKIDLSDMHGGLLRGLLMDDHDQVNQVETSEASFPVNQVETSEASFQVNQVETSEASFQVNQVETSEASFLNQVETSEASFQTKSGGKRAKLTPAQRKENKRKSDRLYREKRKIAEDEQTAEIKHLEKENERLSAKNTRFNELMRLMLHDRQLPAEALLRQDSYITQSTGKQLKHHSFSVQNDGDGKRLKASGRRDEFNDPKAESEPNSGKPVEQNVQPAEPPKQDCIHVEAGSGRSTDSHSLAERGMREKISGRMKILKELLPACNEVHEALALDEITNYIQSLEYHVEFLSLKLLATVNPRMSPPIEAFPHKDDHHGTNSRAIEMEITPANVVPTNDYVTGNQKNPETGTCCNDETPITELLTKIDADDESKVKLSDFIGLDGERIKVGKYSFPISLHPTVERIIDVYGDISATSKMNPSVAEAIYITFCASVKEMRDLQLEQITEDRILKWRDAIKDASRISFKVDFAMEHLKKIACGYIGLMERRKLENVASRISKLEAELSAGKNEHAKITEQSKVYMDVAEEFNGKPVSSGMFQSLDATN